MSLIKVERYLHHPDCEISRVSINGEFFCYSIEDEFRTTKIKGETCIPYGIYPLTTRWSPKFSPTYKHDMIWVQNVPGFEYILIHWGNTVSDTEGCLILGDKIGVINQKDAVLNSRATYLKFYAKAINQIKAGGQQIEYVKLDNLIV
ncbi:MAG: DUF5675 family protein [Bacteroidota bacterium]|nr:DUF5675 family protein [Bacteroidota bacterium]